MRIRITNHHCDNRIVRIPDGRSIRLSGFGRHEITVNTTLVGIFKREMADRDSGIFIEVLPSETDTAIADTTIANNLNPVLAGPEPDTQDQDDEKMSDPIVKPLVEKAVQPFTKKRGRKKQ